MVKVPPRKVTQPLLAVSGSARAEEYRTSHSQECLCHRTSHSQEWLCHRTRHSQEWLWHRRSITDKWVGGDCPKALELSQRLARCRTVLRRLS